MTKILPKKLAGKNGTNLATCLNQHQYIPESGLEFGTNVYFPHRNVSLLTNTKEWAGVL